MYAYNKVQVFLKLHNAQQNIICISSSETPFCVYFSQQLLLLRQISRERHYNCVCVCV